MEELESLKQEAAALRERKRALTEGLHSVLIAADEVLASPDIDSLLRRAVQLLHNRFGVERCGLFLKDGETHEMVGTYGIDRQGRLTDERLHRDPSSNWQWILDFLKPDPYRWFVREDCDLKEWDGERYVVIRRGWLATMLLHSPTGPIGILFNDAATTGAPVNESQQELVAIFATMLGRIVQFRQAQAEREELIARLREALNQVKVLTGILPVCAACKKIRDDEGHWHSMEIYIRSRSEARFSHGICPECARELYPEVYRRLYEQPENS
ncbi:MAG: GAF domain-containing protein [Armatimonadetes bacterium]|nr:GAF domain-containing protein [Armatimonadota bacterium]